MPICFISYANKDKSFVEKELLGLIKALRLESWYARESIEAAEQWETSILRGLEKSRWFILVMSPASAASKYVKKEIAWAMENLKGCIIPVMIQDCDQSEFHPELSKIQHMEKPLIICLPCFQQKIAFFAGAR